MKRNDWIAVLVTVAVLTLCLSGCQVDRHKDMGFESAYDINASLNPEAGTLAHTTQIRIQNTGQDSTNELYFHLDGNLWYEDETMDNPWRTQQEGMIPSYEYQHIHDWLELIDVLEGLG